MLNLTLLCSLLIAISVAVMAEDAALDAVSTSTGLFSNNFFQTVAGKQNGNLITSPLSASVCLAMAFYGARGNTANQMRNVLNLPTNDTLALSGFHSLISNLNSVENVVLRLANKVYTGTGFELEDNYKALTTNSFLSASEQVDFSNGAAAAGIINSWCEQHTNNRIKDVIKPDDLSSDTKVVLVNAVYFKGNWETKFDPALTTPRPFHVDENTVKQVPTMFKKGNFRFGQLQDLKARYIELPYKGKDLSMIIILPDEINGLKEIEKNLQKISLNRLLQEGYTREVELYLPKFKIESTIDLKEILEQMGMTDMFTDSADFSGISKVPLKVDKVVQKAFIEVNEEGSEAAAVTGMMMMVRCMVFPQELVFDKPFIYVIASTERDEKDEVEIITPLFTGHVMDPSN